MAVKYMRRSDGTTGTIPEDVTIDVLLDAATAVDRDVWVSNGNYKLVGIKTTHAVVGGASAAVRPRKITDTSAPGAAAGATVKEVTTAIIDLTLAANTVRTPTLVATQADLRFKSGDRLALDASGTMTGLVGLCVSFFFKKVEVQGADN
jgi:hypothetical protein